MSDKKNPLSNFTVRLSVDDHARLAKLNTAWGTDRTTTLRRLIRRAVPNALSGSEPRFIQVARTMLGRGFAIRLEATGDNHEP